jgi:drug/metabolite transporter, DME family
MRRARAEVLVLLSAVLFGTTGTAQALGPDGASSLSVGAGRIAIGGAALVALVLVTGALRDGIYWAPGPVLAGALGVAAYQLCFFTAVDTTGVAVGTIIAIGSGPAFTGLLGLVLRRRRPNRRWAFATALTVVGAALLMLAVSGGGDVDPTRVALGLGAGASYALYAVASKAMLEAGHRPEGVMAVAFGLGGGLLAPILAFGDTAWLAAPEGAALALYLGLIPTALAYVLFAKGLEKLPAPSVATLTLAEPLTAATLGVIILGERPGAVAALGALLVLSGLLVLAERSRKGTPAFLVAGAPLERDSVSPRPSRRGRPEPADNHTEAGGQRAGIIQEAGGAAAVAAPVTVARIIAAADAERSRLERNLHDGAQQRLVSLALALRAVEARLTDDPEAARQRLASAREELALALDELRDLARGIHPAVLRDRGLGPALNALAARAPVTVQVAALPGERLPEPVETAAYYLVAEALTNVARHAHATVVTVSVTRTGDRARIEVRDDGTGGADTGRGSGLRGLADRLEALGGCLELDSPPGAGTTLIGELPLGSSTPGRVSTRTRPRAARATA